MKPSRGFTLVELMVGMAIGLLVALTAATAMITFDTTQRRDVGEDAALENSAIFLFSVAHEVKNSGISPVDFNNALVCTQFNFSSTDGTLLDAAPVYPVQITDGGASGSDQINVAYMKSILGKSSTRLIGDMTSPAADLAVASSAGFSTGDLVVVGVTGGGSPCTFMQVSSIGAVGLNANFKHAAGSTMPYNPADPAATFTNAPSYPAGSLVFGSGGFAYVSYQVGANGLHMLDNLTTPSNANMINEDVVFMKAQYGISTGSGQPLQWVSAGTAPWNALNSALAAEIKAIHVGIVARNSQFIQPATHGGSCDATVNTGAGSPGKPYLWSGGPTVDLSAALAAGNSSWGCYKYRTYDLVMPLKNVLFQ